MKLQEVVRHKLQLLCGTLALSASVQADAPSLLPNMLGFPNSSGFAASYSTTGSIGLTGPFFQSLGVTGGQRELSPAGRWVDRSPGAHSGALRCKRRYRPDLSPQ